MLTVEQNAFWGRRFIVSLERGGRSDKEGNVYENRFLARLFLQLINEKIALCTGGTC